MVIPENVQSEKPPVNQQESCHALFSASHTLHSANTCYDRLRSLRHSPLDNESAFSDSVNIPSDDHIEISLSNKQLKELILRYTNELPPQQKVVFTLRDVEELEVAEVQIITGLSPEKIKSTLYLARKNIRNKMNQIDPDL